jgi:hypothetical protein
MADPEFKAELTKLTVPVVDQHGFLSHCSSLIQVIPWLSAGECVLELNSNHGPWASKFVLVWVGHNQIRIEALALWCAHIKEVFYDSGNQRRP